jgi:FkbM family methyltransferase
LRVTRAANSLEAKRLEVLAGLGTEVAVDIGANEGQWARELQASGYRGRIISFEPLPQAFAQLQSSARGEQTHDCVSMGLGDRDGEAQFLRTKATVNSSFRAPISARYTNGIEVEEAVTVPIHRLDTVLPALTAERDRFYIKIDTQGFEKEVLTGATQVLTRTDAVEIELSLMELYEGQALLPELWQILVSAGLRPAWVERGYRDSGDIWLFQLDVLFVREEAWNARAGGRAR